MKIPPVKTVLMLLVLKLRLDENKSPDPSLMADYDILLTDSLVRLCYHLQFGKVDPESLDPTWNMSRQVHNKNPVEAIEKAGRWIQLRLNGRDTKKMCLYLTISFDENGNYILKKDVYERDGQVL